MENVQELFLTLDIDLQNTNEEMLTEVFSEAIQKHGFKLSDNNVSLRENKLSSIRAVDLNSGEEVEMYAFAKSLNGKTEVSLKVI
ncbi:hypothetical protein [Persephonella sp.]